MHAREVPPLPQPPQPSSPLLQDPWDADLAREELLTGLFEATVDRHGERTAVEFEGLQVRRRGPTGLVARQKEVTGVTVLDADDFAHLAELGDALEKDDFHGVLLGFVGIGLKGSG